MKILHVTPAFYPATYWGGPTYSLYSLCGALAEIPSLILRVLTTDTAGPSRAASVQPSDFPMIYPNGYEVFFCRRNFAASFSLGMMIRLWPMIWWADLVHLTSVYSAPTIPTLLICRILRKPVVWSPTGALLRWRGSRRSFSKNIWEFVCNRLLSQRRTILHLTSDAEKLRSVQRITRVRPVVIPHGVSLPELDPSRLWQPEGTLRVLFLGRLDPIKGLENLFYAIHALRNTDVSVCVVGEGSASYGARLRSLVSNLRLTHIISFLGKLEGEDKTKAFMRADVCVLPSFFESFGMVVTESLAHGVPVIASKGTPWGEMESRGCGLWVENSPSILADALSAIRNRNLEDMGNQGRHWMAESFSWDDVRNKMLTMYQTLKDECG